jgi:hypothetical protein
MSEYVCEDCAKSYKSRSGLWKHQKKMGHGKFADPDNTIPIEETKQSVGVEGSSPQTEPIHSSDPIGATPTDTQPAWMDFDFGTSDSTDTIPTAFKSVLTPVPAGKTKMSKGQIEALEKQNKGILKMFLTTTDVLLTKYAQAITLDPDISVAHSEADKDLVANAQYRWMEEKGFFLTNYISTGMIAGGLTLHYVAAPVIRVRKKAKKKLFKGRGLLARLPLIGRLFKRKTDVIEIGQNAEEVELNER